MHICSKVHELQIISDKCIPTLYIYKAPQTTKQLLQLLQFLKVWTLENNTNTFVLTMDKVVSFHPLFKVAKLILTAFQGNQKHTLKDLLRFIRDLVQFTPCLLIHGEIVSIIPTITLLMDNIITIIQIRKAIKGTEIIPS